MDHVETVIVGAGVIGLAVARELARSGREVVVLERETAVGTATSSRNSEVLHAGLYYEPGSLKAALCVSGRRQLIDFCRERGVETRMVGKLIVAADEAQRCALERIEGRSIAAGVGDLHWLERPALSALEPALQCRSALFSPSTGIVDSHGLLLALLGDAQDHGAALALQSTLTRGEVTASGFSLQIDAGGAPTRIRCRELVNAAGLEAQAVATAILGVPDPQVPSLHRAKGNYFALSGRAPFSRLIYPIPDESGLGVHFTLDLGGQGRFGPDVEWVPRVDYRVDPRRADRFYASIREYWPGLPDGALSPAYAGIRPKIVGPDEPAGDFRIDGEQLHRARGLVNLFGIESPGLTASLAIAVRVRENLDRVR